MRNHPFTPASFSTGDYIAGVARNSGMLHSGSACYASQGLQF